MSDEPISNESEPATDGDRPQWFEELRFAKKQQWAIATAVVTLLAAIVALAHGNDPGPKEKVVLAVVVTLVAAFGCTFLVMLQRYMRDTRLRIDPTDKDALLRGTSIVGALVGVVILGAIAVLYITTLR